MLGDYVLMKIKSVVLVEEAEEADELS